MHKYTLRRNPIPAMCLHGRGLVVGKGGLLHDMVQGVTQVEWCILHLELASKQCHGLLLLPRESRWNGIQFFFF